MNSEENPEVFYDKFQKQLEASQKWPGLYMFKFIVKSKSGQLEKLKEIFDNSSDGMSLANSSKNRFQSLTVTKKMKSPLEVIEIYKKAGQIEGVMIL